MSIINTLLQSLGVLGLPHALYLCLNSHIEAEQSKYGVSLCSNWTVS